jgi:hypothetical protein
MAGQIGVHGHFALGGAIQPQNIGANAQGGGAQQGGAAAGGAGQQGDTVEIGGLQVPTSFKNHGQEVSWAAHHGIHGTDLSQIADKSETVQQFLQDQQNTQNAANGNAQAGAQPNAAGGNNGGNGNTGLTTFLTNLTNQIKTFLADQKPAAQPAVQPGGQQTAAK